MPDLQSMKLAAGAAIVALVLLLLWITAKAVVPFAIGLLCGAAAAYFWGRKG